MRIKEGRNTLTTAGKPAIGINIRIEPPNMIVKPTAPQITAWRESTTDSLVMNNGITIAIANKFSAIEAKREYQCLRNIGASNALVASSILFN